MFSEEWYCGVPLCRLRPHFDLSLFLLFRESCLAQGIAGKFLTMQSGTPEVRKASATASRPASLGNSLCANNESSWSGPHKIEGVAGHQSQDIVTRIIQYFGILGPNHFYGVHAIAIGTLESH